MSIPRKVNLRGNTYANISCGPDYVYLGFWDRDALDHHFSCSKEKAIELAETILQVVKKQESNE